MSPEPIDFQAAFEAMPVCGLLLLPDAPTYTVAAVSNELLRITGTDRAAVVGRSLFEAYPGSPVGVQVSGPTTLRAVLDQMLAERQPRRLPAFRYDVRTADGTFAPRYWSTLSQPVLDAEGAVRYLLQYPTDVTEQVQAQQREQARQQAEKTFGLLMQAPVALGLATGPNFVLALANERLHELMGTTPAIIGQPLAEALPEMAEQGVLALLEQVRTTGQPYYGTEFALRLRPHGPEVPRYFNLIYSPYYEHVTASEASGVFCVAHDVTEQMLARQRLEESQQDLQRFQFMADQARDPFVLIRPDGSLAYVNQRALDNWGYSAQEATQLTIPDIDPLFPAAAFSEIFTRAHREPIAPFDSRHRRKDGTEYPVSISISGLLLGGEPHLFAIPRDVTESRQVLVALQEANEQLRRTNADLDTFVYLASHDLKAPITNIEGLLAALREQLPAAVQHTPLITQLLALMDGSVARFQQTLGHLTEVVQLNHEQSRPAAELVNLSAVLEAVRLDILPELVAAGVTLSVALDDCPALRFSARNLRSILYNLLSNAVKYRSPARQSQVWLRCRPGAPGFLVLEVQDNGLGLSEQQQGELFQLFRRLHHHVAGSGVGLYMVKKMVDNAGGTLTVHSELGVGSTFVVLLPLGLPVRPGA